MEPWRPTVLEGRIVCLEPLVAAHGDALWRASRDPRTWKWLNVVQPQTRERFGAFVADALAAAAAGAEIPFATVLAETGRPVGSTRFMALRPAHRSLEIGSTWLHPDAWGSGANVEAKLLQLRQAFDGWGCRRVEFKTDARNERSRRALEALGARFEGIHEKHMLVRNGESRDSAWYAILDDDWPVVEALLRRRLDRRGR